MNKKIKFLLTSLLLSSIVIIPSLASIKAKENNFKSYSNNNLNNLQKQFITLNKKEIKSVPIKLEKTKNVLSQMKQVGNHALVSHITSSPILRRLQTTIPNYSNFSGFWSLLSDVEKGLFITFLTGAGTAVLGGIGYGIYKGIEKSRKGFQNQQEDEQIAKKEENGPGSYKLTLTVSKDSEKSKEWSVYAFGGNGFQDPERQIGTFDKNKTDEANKSKMTKSSDGIFTFDFDKVKDPSQVTVILKTGDSGSEQSEPFELGDFLSGGKKSDKKLYVYDDCGPKNLMPKSGVVPIGEVTVVKTSSTAQNNN